MSYSKINQYEAKTIIMDKPKGDICWKMLLFMAFFSPLRCYGLFTIGPYTGSLFKIFSALMILCAFIKTLTSSYKIYLDTPAIILFCIILYDLIGGLLSRSTGLFPSYIVAHVVLLFSYIVVQNATGSTESLLKAYIYGAIIPGILGLYQWVYVMLGRGVPKLPFQQFLVSAGKDDIFLYGNYRVVGTLQDPSYYGLYMGSVFAICIGFLVVKGLSNKFRGRLMVIFIAILSLVCIFSSGSITSMGGVVASTTFLVLLNRTTFSKLFKYVFIVGVVLFIALFFMNNYFNYDPLQVAFEKMKIQSTDSDIGAMYGREVFFHDAIVDFWKNPIFGVGFGNMTRTSAHNSFLTILAMQGILGIVLHLILLVFYPFFGHTTKKILHVSGNQRNDLVICLAALLGMLVQVLGYDCLYKMDSSIVVILFALSSIYSISYSGTSMKIC